MGKTITPADAVKTLRAAGFVEVAQKGSHKKMRHPDGRWTIVPMHRRDMGVGLVRAIEKQTRVKLRD